MIKVGYLNVRGLTRDKVVLLTAHLQERNLDILFLSETWYIDHENLTRHPLYFSSTSTSTFRANMRQKDGIVCLGLTKKTLKRRHCKIAGTSDYQIVKCDQDLPRITVIARCREIEKLDRLIMTTIQRTAEEILGVYVPKVIKKRPDSLKKELETANSNNIAIQAFKRIQRVTVTPLSSSRSELSVEEDVSRHIQEVYRSPPLELSEPEKRPQHWIMFPL
jgi:hypothetical protein